VSAGVDAAGDLTVTIEDSAGGQALYVFTHELLLEHAGEKGSFARPGDQVMIPPYLVGLADGNLWYLDARMEGSIPFPTR
jgi:hypothetical protein